MLYSPSVIVFMLNSPGNEIDSALVEDTLNSLYDFVSKTGIDESLLLEFRKSLDRAKNKKDPGELVLSLLGLYFSFSSSPLPGLNVTGIHDGIKKINALIESLLPLLNVQEQYAVDGVIVAQTFFIKSGIKDPAYFKDLDLFLRNKLFSDEDLKKDPNYDPDFPLAQMQYPFTKERMGPYRSAENFAGLDSKLDLPEYAFLRAKYSSPKARFDMKMPGKESYKHYEEFIEAFLATLASDLVSVANPIFFADNIKGNSLNYLKRLVTLCGNINAVKKYSNLSFKVKFLLIDHYESSDKELKELAEAIGKEATFIGSEKMFMFHVISGLNKAVGHPERDPKNANDRALSYKEMSDACNGAEFFDPALLPEIEVEAVKFLGDNALKKIKNTPEYDPELCKQSVQFAVDCMENELNKNPQDPFLLDARFKKNLEAYLAEAKGYLLDFSTYDPERAFADNIFICDHYYRAFDKEKRESLNIKTGKHVLIFSGKITDPDQSLKPILDVFMNLGSALDIMRKRSNFKDFLASLYGMFSAISFLQQKNLLKGADPKFFALFSHLQSYPPVTTESDITDAELYVNEPLLFAFLLKFSAAQLVSEFLLPQDSLDCDLSIESNRIKITDAFRNALHANLDPKSHRVFLPLMKAFFLKSNQVLRDAVAKQNSPSANSQSAPSGEGSGASSDSSSNPSGAPVPGSAAQSKAPNQLEISGKEFSKLSQFAGVHFAPKKGRLEKVYQRDLETEIEEAINACKNKASTLPEPLLALVDLEKKDYCKAIKIVRIQRGAGEGAEKLSNLICHGDIGISSGKNILKFGFKMDENGEVTFLLGADEIKKEKFSSPAMQNFYKEFQRIILVGLKDSLVKVSTGAEQLKFAGVGTSPSQRNGSVHSSDPEKIVSQNIDDMFVIQNGNSSSSNPIGPIIPKETSSISDLLNGGKTILPENVEGLKIYQEEVRDAGKKEVKVYVPVHHESVASTLEEVRTGKLSPEHVFLLKQRGVIKRIGYQPWQEKGEPGTMNLSQRSSGIESQVLAEHLEMRHVGVLGNVLANERQFYVLKTEPEVKRVRIRIKNALGEFDPVMFLPDDAHYMLQGLKFENGLSDGAAHIDASRGLHAQPVQMANGEVGYKVAMVMNIPQNVQYVQGSFMSLDEAMRMLASKASVAGAGV